MLQVLRCALCRWQHPQVLACLDICSVALACVALCGFYGRSEAVWCQQCLLLAAIWAQVHGVAVLGSLSHELGTSDPLTQWLLQVGCLTCMRARVAACACVVHHIAGVAFCSRVGLALQRCAQAMPRRSLHLQFAGSDSLLAIFPSRHR